MKNAIKWSLRFSARHLPDLLSLFLAIAFFLFATNYFITEKSLVQRLVPTLIGFGGGMVGGGILGWIVGGIGIVAMGTGVGIGALGAIIVGSIAGAVFGGLTGTSFSFLLFLMNPTKFYVAWPGLILATVGTAAVFLGLRLVTRRLRFLNRFKAGPTE